MYHHGQKNQTLQLQIWVYSENETIFFTISKYNFIDFLYILHEIDTCKCYNIYTC